MIKILCKSRFKERILFFKKKNRKRIMEAEIITANNNTLDL